MKSAISRSDRLCWREVKFNSLSRDIADFKLFDDVTLLRHQFDNAESCVINFDHAEKLRHHFDNATNFFDNATLFLMTQHLSILNKTYFF